MVAVQAANNETGVLQPTRRIAELAHAAGAVFVCDAVQLAGRAPCDAEAIGADVLILSSHKLGGPKGVGAVVLVGERVQPEPLIRGGGQERRQRSGTENVAGIAGFAAAFDGGNGASRGFRQPRRASAAAAGGGPARHPPRHRGVRRSAPRVCPTPPASPCPACRPKRR